jgi:hypothetical protein
MEARMIERRLAQFTCGVGVVIKKQHGHIPLFLIDYGAQHDSLFSFLSRNKRFELKVSPLNEDLFTYSVSGDIVVRYAPLSQQSWTFLKRSTKEESRLRKGAGPEFVVHVDVDCDTHEKFSIAWEHTGGVWLLVVLTNDASVFVIKSSGEIAHKICEARTKYVA